ncbi:NAD(P)-binding protein, partial [Staphylococcus aureus]
LRGALATAGTVAGAAFVDAVSPAVFRESVDVDENAGHWAAALPAPLPALERDLDADVVVIGAGLTGLSAAWRLRTRDPGRRVVV